MPFNRRTTSIARNDAAGGEYSEHLRWDQLEQRHAYGGQILNIREKEMNEKSAVQKAYDEAQGELERCHSEYVRAVDERVDASDILQKKRGIVERNQQAYDRLLLERDYGFREEARQAAANVAEVERKLRAAKARERKILAEGGGHHEIPIEDVVWTPSGDLCLTGTPDEVTKHARDLRSVIDLEQLRESIAELNAPATANVQVKYCSVTGDVVGAEVLRPPRKVCGRCGYDPEEDDLPF